MQDVLGIKRAKRGVHVSASARVGEKSKPRKPPPLVVGQAAVWFDSLEQVLEAIATRTHQFLSCGDPRDRGITQIAPPRCWVRTVDGIILTQLF